MTRGGQVWRSVALIYLVQPNLPLSDDRVRDSFSMFGSRRHTQEALDECSACCDVVDVNGKGTSALSSEELASGGR